MVVTHDRWFLDAVCERTWEVHDGVVDAYDGGYAAYVLARAPSADRRRDPEERRQNLLRKELAWLRRGPPARTSKPRFRIDAATALIADEPPPRDRMALEQFATARLGKDVVDLEDVTYELPASRTLLRDVTWRLGPGDRVGLVGVNGSGKTTLLRLVMGDVRPTSGRVKRGATVRTAMLTQEVRELDEVNDLRVQEAVEKVRGSVRIGDRDVTAGQMLENLGFARERVWTPVRDLSGGERRRLQLLRLLMAEPNVLALDEPTNDLDTDTLAAVEDALDGWPGTLLVVSHDRYLLERICDRQVAPARRRRRARPAGRRRGVPGAAPRGARRRVVLPAVVGDAAAVGPLGGRRPRRPQGAGAARTPALPARRPGGEAARADGRAGDRPHGGAGPRRRAAAAARRARPARGGVAGGRRDRRLTRGSPPY